MWAFLFLWGILTCVTFLLVLGRCTGLIYIVFCTPIALTFLYFIFKNDTYYSNDNTVEFFTNFRVGGHRGSPVHAPENTIESFKKAKEEGCQLVEFDIHMSADGIPLLMHDETTGRTGKTNIVISSTPWKDIERVQLNQVNGVSANDMKNDNLKLILKVAEEIGSRRIYNKVMVSSFNPMIPYRLKKIDPKIITGLTLDRSYYSFSDDERKKPFTVNVFYHWFNEVLDEINMLVSPTYILPRFLGVDVLMLSYKLISENIVRESHEKGFSVIAWTVNDKDYMKLVTKLRVPFLTDVAYEVRSQDLNAGSSEIVVSS
ncbi:unnamed protein product [Caenorhabditis bovis]|uniref:GP-PDE domain-containing protein n=1 Tax=Caenorhabditis bovis TaxID=2654633 RepID=A0A8S1E8I7_9PELO|nr:unnamed protein product [Caenorhabditis bovis]